MVPGVLPFSEIFLLSSGLCSFTGLVRFTKPEYNVRRQIYRLLFKNRTFEKNFFLDFDLVCVRKSIFIDPIVASRFN